MQGEGPYIRHVDNPSYFKDKMPSQAGEGGVQVLWLYSADNVGDVYLRRCKG